MENPEEILHSLEEFSKVRPKDIPRELEEYLLFVAKTGNPVYQWSAIKSLFREKMINVITEFYEACPSVDIPPCPNVDLFNYDTMKNFILEKLDTFASAPFTVQRLCELLTTPRKEYNRIDKYMRALEKNILVVSTVEPGGRRTTENGEGIMNGLESEHLPETSNSSNDINVEEMDDTPPWPRVLHNNDQDNPQIVQETVVTASKISEIACTSSQDSVITCRTMEETYVSIEPVPSNVCTRQESIEESDVSVTITAIPAGVQKRRNSVEPVVSSQATEQEPASCSTEDSDQTEATPKEDLKFDDGTSSSLDDEVKDADSSSNPEEDQDPEDIIKQDTTTDDELTSSSDIVEVQQVHNEDASEVVSEAETKDVVVDTTKCSDLPNEEIGDVVAALRETNNKTEAESEISSSDRIVGEVTALNQDLLLNTDEAEAKVDENEAKPVESEVLTAVQSSLETPTSQSDEVDACPISEPEISEQSTCTPMEVDEVEEKIDDDDDVVVKAEATSDSPL